MDHCLSYVEYGWQAFSQLPSNGPLVPIASHPSPAPPRSYEARPDFASRYSTVQLDRVRISVMRAKLGRLLYVGDTLREGPLRWPPVSRLASV